MERTLTETKKIKADKNRPNLKRDWQLYVMIFIPMLYFLVFKYIPMYGVTIAFKNYTFT